MRMQGCGIKYLPTEEELSREIREQKEFFELPKIRNYHPIHD